MKSINFIKSLLTNLIPPKNSELPKISSLKFMFKSQNSLSNSWIPANKGSKFKLDYAKSKNSYILLMEVINFKLSAINLVYLIETPGKTRV